jgi:hypothetical protein
MSKWARLMTGSRPSWAVLVAGTTAVVVLVGCRPQDLPEPAPLAPRLPQPQHQPQEGPGVQSPLLVRWLPIHEAAADVQVVTLEVKRPTVALPLTVLLRVPAGVVVLTAPDLTAVQRPATGATLLSWRLQGDAALHGQVVAVVDGQLAGLGAHAEVPLRAAVPVPNRPQARRLVLPGGKPVIAQPLTTPSPQQP